jgi:hypothetical protein
LDCFHRNRLFDESGNEAGQRAFGFGVVSGEYCFEDVIIADVQNWFVVTKDEGSLPARSRILKISLHSKTPKKIYIYIWVRTMLFALLFEKIFFIFFVIKN